MTATLSNDPYSLSKRLEEEAIDHFVAGLAPEAKFTYAYINPGAVSGCVVVVPRLHWLLFDQFMRLLVCDTDIGEEACCVLCLSRGPLTEPGLWAYLG